MYKVCTPHLQPYLLVTLIMLFSVTQGMLGLARALGVPSIDQAFSNVLELRGTIDLHSVILLLNFIEVHA